MEKVFDFNLFAKSKAIRVEVEFDIILSQIIGQSQHF